MKKIIPIVGMACSGCAARVERTLSSLNGINNVAVSLAGRTVTVDYEPATISLEQMKKAVADAGYDLVIESNRSAEEINRTEYNRLRRSALLSWLFAALTMTLSMGWITPFGHSATSGSSTNQLCLAIALLNIIYCGRRFYISAWRQLTHGGVGMDTLVALSTFIAFAFSSFNTFAGDAVWGSRGIEWHTYFDASVMIITFVLTGRCIEERAKDGVAGSIRRLMGLQPTTARLVTAAGIDEIPLATVKVGDELEVRAGDKIPVDGTVASASSFMTADAAYIDESMMNGEPAPAAKRTGDRVAAGTIVSQGSLRMTAQQVGESTALANIIRMVQEAQNSKAPIQRIVDRMSLVFVQSVASIAVVTFLAWWIIGGNAALPQAIMSAVAVLVIACPCAMGLATPTALMVGIGRAASRQILIKDAAALENLRRVDTIVIDKTGTLTIPNKSIDFTRSDSLSFEERESLKPHAAEAIAALRRQGIDICMISGDRDEAVAYWAGKAGIEHFKSEAHPGDKQALVQQLQRDGHTVAMIGDGINDTQALATADVSIAIGRGTDVAMDVAQVTLMSDDLGTIAEAVTLSRRTSWMIRQNLFWAFIYNIVCIPLAAGVPRLFGIDFSITPMWASALMALSSISVVANSLRLRG